MKQADRCLTRPDKPMTSETLAELKACWLYFPGGRKLVERIDAIYSDKPDLYKAVLLSAIVAILDRLL
jgi:hypothetical protein